MNINSHFSNWKSHKKKMSKGWASSLLRTSQKNVGFIPAFIPCETVIVTGHKLRAKFWACFISERHLPTLRTTRESGELGAWTRHIPAACLPEPRQESLFVSLIPTAHDELLTLIYLATTASELTSRMFMPLLFVNIYFKYASIGDALLLFIKMFLSPNT